MEYKVLEIFVHSRLYLPELKRIASNHGIRLHTLYHHRESQESQERKSREKGKDIEVTVRSMWEVQNDPWVEHLDPWIHRQ